MTFYNPLEENVYIDISKTFQNIALFEKQGIDDNIRDTVKEIVDKINNNCGNEKEYIDDHNRLNISSNVSTIINSYNTEIYYRFIVFDSYPEFFDNRSIYFDDLIYDTKADGNTIIIHITSFMVEGIILSKYFEEPLYHELAHAYELTRKNLNMFNTVFSEEDYARVCDIIKNPNSDIKEKTVAECAYYCCKFEKQAFIHELYAYLIQYNTSSIDSIYKKFKSSRQNDILTTLNTVLTYRDMYKPEIEKILDISPEKFFRFVEKRYNEYINTIGKMIYRIYQDNLSFKHKISFDFSNKIK